MPARDAYHHVVVRVLESDGWRITHDPYRITVGRKNIFVDLAAEQIIAAEREGRKIAVEVKTFGGPSEVRELEEALGQYLLYIPFLRKQESDRLLYMAVPAEVYGNLFQEPIGQGVLTEYHLRLLLFNPTNAEDIQWIPKP